MMSTVSEGKTVAFIIPVRHPQNARNWPGLIARLQQTLASIAAQTSTSWCCVVVANEEAQLPPMPDGVSVLRVDLPPNPLYQMDHANREAVYEAVRVDKGLRVLAGMKAARAARFFMVVDDDDFVSRDLVAFAEQNRDAPGWYFDRGYVWTEGSRFLFLRSDFSKLCGTSHLIRSDLYRLPDVLDEAAMDYVKAMMGSHIKMETMLEAEGYPLAPLPFVGAVYRVGHVEAHSQSRNVFRSHLLNRETVGRPRQFLANAARFRLLDRGHRNRFGMSPRT